MKLSVSTLILYRQRSGNLATLLNAVETVKNWEVVDEGFHRLDRRQIRQLVEVANTRGIKYSVHAPFSSINLAEAESKLRKVFLNIMKKSLRFSFELDATIWVLHSGRLTPFTYFFPEDAWAAHNDSLRELSKVASDLGIQIAVENMPGRYELFNSVATGKKLFESVTYENVGLCLDVGHANIVGDATQFYIDLADQILHIHIHDNDGLHDGHLTVGQGNVNWTLFFDQLIKKDYDGTLVFENYDLSDVRAGIDFFTGLHKSVSI